MLERRLLRRPLGGCSPRAAVPATCSTTRMRSSSTGQSATLGEVETRQAAVAKRIQSRQPWFAVVTMVGCRRRRVERGEGMVLFRARKNDGGRPLGERIRDTLERHRGRARCAWRHRRRRRWAAVDGSPALHLFDVDKRASERALGMLQFCHLALRTTRSRACSTSAQELDCDRVDGGRHPRARRQAAARGEKKKAREIVDADEHGARESRARVGDYLHALGRGGKGAEGARGGRKGLDVAVVGSRARSSRCRGAQGSRRRRQARRREAGRQDGDVKALQARSANIDTKVKSSSRVPSAAAQHGDHRATPGEYAATTAKKGRVASKPVVDLGTARP